MIDAPVSWGELADKITILEIKAERIEDMAKRANVQRELDLLREKMALAPDRPGLTALVDGLRAVNLELWVIEDDIRDCERAKDFGARFIALARAVYQTNDRRAALKKDINLLLGSGIVEEKSYKPY
ncbi:MAG: DUF6165 family protein [Labrys sp. (in: a-proteobacteria)]|jgi:hypothetical protein